MNLCNFDMDASEDPLTVKYSSSLLNSEILIKNNEDLLDKETSDVDIESISERVTFTCQPCKKVYLTKGGFNRHIRRVHQTAHIKLTDDDLQSLFLESITELSTDPCYVIEQQLKWKNMKFSANLSLFSSIKTIYEKMKTHVNPEKFHVDYSQVMMGINILFPGLDFMSTTELLRKTGDKVLAHFQKSFRTIENCSEIGSVPPLTENEFEALDYLGGYVIYNVEKS